MPNDRPLALVTGASTGIGYELARCCAEHGFDLLIAVYNASKPFLDSFSFALGHGLRDTGVTVTCLMPGATETEFFARADLLDTRIGQSKKEHRKRAEPGSARR